MQKKEPFLDNRRQKLLRRGALYSARSGFGVAPILYMLGLIGVGAGVLFSSYSQSLKNNINLTNSVAVKNDLDAAATTLAATSVLGVTDPSVLCPPQGGYDSTGNCVNAPTKMIEIYPSASVSASDKHLPTSYANASSSGSPVETGIFSPSAGVKQLDPWGHYYIYCRWESPANSTTNPAMEIISAGPDGILQTKCGATVATGDDQIISMNAANAVNRSAVWQTGTVAGSSTPDVYYGTVGHQLNIDANGNLTVPGNVSVDGSYSSTSGNIVLGNGTFEGNLAGGTVSGTTGAFSDALSAEGTAFTVSNGGTLSAANGAFSVNTGGTLAAANGSFNVDSTGSLSVGSSAFTVDAATGNSAIGGTLGVIGTIVAGKSSSPSTPSLQTYGAVNIGINLLQTGSSTPYLSVGKAVSGFYPFYVDQTGDVISTGGASSLTGSFTGNFNGSVAASGVTDSGAMQVSGNYTSASGNITIGGTVTAANFIGNIALGGGGATVTGVLPIVNGGTGASDATTALANLGVTSYGYLNTNLLTTGLIPGADIVSGSVTSTQLNSTGVAAGTYTGVTVGVDGRVISGVYTPIDATTITDGNGDKITAGSSGLLFVIGSVQQGIWTSTGLGVGTNNPGTKLDINGNIRIENAAGAPSTPNQLQLMNGSTSERWSFTTDNATESPGNVGSNFTLNSYTNSGSLLGTPLTINRATGNASFTGTVTATSFSGSGAGLTGIGTSSITGTLGTANGGTGTSTTFTQGSVVFAGPSGIYTQDNSQFFWDDTAHKLGIGTSAPVSKVQIAGGEVQVGSSGMSCTSSNGGALRFSGSTIYYCDGTSAWQALYGTSGGVGSGINLGTTVLTANPSISGDTTTGFYTAGPGKVDVTILGNQAIEWSSSGENIINANGGLQLGGSNGIRYLSSDTVPGASIAIGSSALVGQTVGTNYNNLAIGLNAMGLGTLTTAAISNSAVGTNAMAHLTSGQKNVAFGTSALQSITSGGLNTAVGFQSMLNNTTGGNNTALGYSALATNISGAYNTAVGVYAMNYNYSGIGNTASGYFSLANNTNGNGNSAYGYNALYYDHYNSANTAIGQFALYNFTGPGNAGTAATTNNTAIGSYAMYNGGTSTAGIQDTAVGGNSLYSFSTGSNNTAIGYNSLYTVTTGANNTALGTAVGSTGLITGSNDILIGTDQTTTTPATGTNNWLNIGNAIYGYNFYNATNPTGIPQIAIGSGITSVTAGAVLDLSSNTTSANSSMVLPSGLTSTRPTIGVNGMVRYNSTFPAVEAFVGGSWTQLVTSGSSGAGAISLGTSTTAANPAISGDATSGFYTAGAGKVDVTISGTQTTEWSAAGENIISANTGLLIAGSNAIRFPTSDTTSGASIAIGSGALAGQIIGTSYGNTAVGYQSMALGAISGIANTALGYTALKSLTTGKKDTALGYSALAISSAGNAGVAVGYNSLSNSTADNNTAVGAYSQQSTTTATYNTSVGEESLYANTIGGNNTAVGGLTLHENVAGVESTALGYSAMRYANSSSSGFTTYNTAVGAYALQGSSTAANNTGTQNTAIGHYALASNTSGTRNSALGNYALYANSSASYNTATGVFALENTTIGSSNTAMGYNALVGNQTGGNNAAFGAGTLANTTTGGSNVGIGGSAAQGNVSGSGITVVGVNAMLFANNSAAGFTAANTAVGMQALYGSTTAANNTGTYNTALGYQTLFSDSSGAFNTVLGSLSGNKLTTGSDNTILGYKVAFTTLNTGSNNILIGTDASTDVPTDTSNWLNIGNAIYGTNLKNNINTAGIPQIAIGSNITSITTGAVLDLSSNTTSANSSLVLPVGTSGARPTTGVNGMVRYNVTYPAVEAFVGGSWTQLLTSGSSGAGSLSLGTSTSAANPAISGDTTSGFYTNGAGKVDVTISGAQIAEWNSSGFNVLSGNVGIGTASPAFTLDVNGASIFRNNVNISTSISSTANNDLRLYSNNSTNLGIEVQSGTGFVGVGTNSPSYVLDVRAQSGGSPELTVRQQPAGAAFFEVFQKDTGGTLIGDNWSSTAFGAAATNAAQALTEYMRIAVGGNVGIGTTAPTQKLTVAGNIDAMSNGYLTEIANGAAGTTANTLAKLSSGAAVIPLTTDTDGIVGIVVGSAGTTGNAQIAVNGQASCVFDGATTAGHYVTISTTTAGDCKDAGASRPTSTQTIGRVLSTNAAAGTYAIALGLNGAVSGLGSGVNLGTSTSTANPSISGDPTSGFYTAGPGLVDVTISGTQTVEFPASGENIVNANTGLLLGGMNAIRYPASDTTVGASIAIGSGALAGQTAGASYRNTAIGYLAISSTSVTGIANTAVGYSSLKATTSGYNNSGFGFSSMSSLTTGYLNTGLGAQALTALTTGNYNTAVGAGAMSGMTGGSNNTAVGYTVFSSLAAASQANTGLGSGAGYTNFGSNNTAIGYQAMTKDGGGSNNTIVGMNAMGEPTTLSSGGNNVALGYTALYNDLSGNNNTALGYASLYNITTGANNTAIGLQVGKNTLTIGSNNILMGTDSTTDVPNASTSNWMNIGNAIYGYNLYNTNNPTGVPQIAIGTGITSVTAGAVLDLSSNTTIANSSMVLPSGLTSTRPTTGVNGMVRYNSTYPAVEAFVGGSWTQLLTSGSSGAGSISLGTTTTAANPAISGDATSGFYTAGAGKVDVTISGTRVAEWNSSGFDVVSGSVGIGTTSPGQLLDVENTSTGSGDAIYGNNSGASNTGAGVYGTNNSSSGMGVYGANTNGGNGVYGTGANGVKGVTASSNGSGVVGLANSSSNASAGVTAQNSGTTNTGYALYATNSSTTGWGIYSAGTSPNYFAGSVGIGVIAPLASLDVASNNVTANGAVHIGDNTNTSSVIGVNQRAYFGYDNAGNGAAVVQGATTKGIEFAVNNSTIGSGIAMIIGSSGLVGIGTTTPSQKLTVSGNVDAMSNGYLTEIANSAVGTTANTLAKLSSAGAALTPVTTDTDGIVGIVVGSAGTSGNAQIAVDGQASCIFDGATTAGHYVTISSLTAGDCKDAGASRPTATQTIGRVLSTNGSAGTYAIALGLNGAVSGLGSGVNLGTSTTTSNPSISGDLTSGFYTAGPALVDVTISGTQMVEWSATGENIINANLGLKMGGSNAISFPSSDTTINGSVAIGSNALSGQTTAAGYKNTAVGAQSMSTSLTTAAVKNTALGYQSLAGLNSGALNTGIGYQGLFGITSGSSDTSLGTYAANSTTTGNNNVAAGVNALGGNVAGNESTAIGFDAMYYANSSATAFTTYNTAVGAYALMGSATPAGNTGVNNTAVGHSSLTNDTSGSSNTAVGYLSLNGTNTGNLNTAMGFRALQLNQTGGSNTAVGYAAAYQQTGSSNSAFGTSALNAAGTNNDNTAMGSYSLQNATGTGNTALGKNAGGAVTSGNYNTALGEGVGNVTLTTGTHNILIGTDATTDTPAPNSGYWMNIGNAIYGTNLYDGANPTGIPQIAIGSNITSITAGAVLDLSSNTTSANSSLALPAGTTSTRPTTGVNGMVRYNVTYPAVEAFVGGSWTQLLTSGSSGAGSISLGTSTIAANPAISGDATSGFYTAGAGKVDVTISGTQIAEWNSGGFNVVSGKVGIGTASPAAALDVYASAGIGAINLGGVNGISYPASDTTPSASIAIGSGALVGQTIGTNYNNTAIGYHSMFGTLTSGATGNAAVGFQALRNNTGGGLNTAIGYDALQQNTTGFNNVAIGAFALSTNLSGSADVAIGRNALLYATGANNTAIGYAGQSYLSSGNSNTSLGHFAMLGISSAAPLTGSYNTALGDSSLLNLQGAASNNTVLGYYVGGSNLTTGSSNILIGVGSTNVAGGADTPTSSTSNFLNIGNILEGNMANATNVNNPVMYLNSANGNVGIGTTAPSSTMEIQAASPLLTVDANAAAAAGIKVIGGGVSPAYLELGNKYIYTPSGTPSILYIGNSTTVGSSQVVIDALGDVGIGTTTPATSLEVVSGSGGGIRLTRAANPSGYAQITSPYGTYNSSTVSVYGINVLDFQAGGAQGGISVGAGFAGGLYQAPTNGMIVQGSVGVGTTTTTQKLTVSGNIDAMSNGYLTEIANAAITGTTANTLAKLSTSGTALTPLTTDTDGVVGVVVGGAGTSGNAQIAVNGQASCVFDGATNAGDYVTISTTTAGDCKDAGSSRTTATQTVGRVLSTNTGAGTYTIALGINGAISSLGSGINLGSSTTTANPAISGDATSGFYTAGAAKVDVTISGTQIAEWNSGGFNVLSGNVGIGTASPTSALTILGANSSSNANQGLVLSSSTGTAIGPRLAIFPQGNFSSAFQTLATGGSMNFLNSSGVATASFLDSGFVGIGTTSPANPLDVVGVILSRENNGAVSNQVYINAGNTATAASSNVNRLRFGGGDTNPNYFTIQGAANADYLTINNGNVGIGTNAPGALLNLWGIGSPQLQISYDATHLTNMRTTSVGDFNIASSSGATFIGPYSSATGLYVLGTGTTANVSVGTSSIGSNFNVYGNASVGASYVGAAAPTNGMIIQGSVGIGSSIPAYPLDVVGTTNATAFLAHTTTFGVPVLTGYTNGGIQAVQLALDGSNNGYMKLVPGGGGVAGNILLTSLGTSYIKGGNLAIGTTTASNALTVLGNVDAMTNGYLTEITNATTTGTTANKLAKLSIGSALVAGTSDTDGILGIVVGSAGTTGNAQIATAGQATCVFDGATTAGDYVTISSSTVGDCKDAGASRPTSTQTIGRVLTTNLAAGTYGVALSLNGAVSGLGSGITLGTSTTTANPAISGDPTSGFYTAGPGKVDVTISGTQTTEWSAAGENIINANTGLLLGGVNGIRYPSSDATPGGSVAIGSTALVGQTIGTAYYNIALGLNAMGLGTMTSTAVQNLAIGPLALSSLTTGHQNVAVGYGALPLATAATYNTGVGVQALNALTVGVNNTAVGYQSLFSNTYGAYNTAVGVQALKYNSSGNNNSALGYFALSNSSSGISNTAMGYYSLFNEQYNNGNTAIGNYSMYNFHGPGTGGTSASSNNTAIGNYSLYGAVSSTGILNTSLGAYSLYSFTSGASNTATGYQALYNLTTGSMNTAMGYQVGSSTLTTGSNNILIGTDVTTDVPTTSTSNWMNIGNAIYGYNLYNASNTFGVPQIAIGTGLTSVTAGAVLDLSSNTTSANSSLALPSGTTSTRPTTGVNGMVRYNATYPAVEAFVGGTWTQFVTSGSSGAGSISLGTSTSASNPAISGDATTGLYTAGAGKVDVSISGTQKAEWNSGGFNVLSGSVGVGTSNPTSTLQVNAVTPTVSITGTTSSTLVQSATSVAFNLQGNGSAGMNIQNASASATPALINMAKFGAAGLPQANDQLGAIVFNASNSSYVYTPVAAITAQLSGTPTNLSMPTYLAFSTTPSGSNGYSERMRIDSTGYVGIGTAVPQTPLHVHSALNDNLTVSDVGGVASIFAMNDARSSYIPLQFAGQQFIVNTNSVEQMRITASGQVGLGTNSPAAGAVLDMSANTTTANSSMILPGGLSSTRPTTGINGMVRYNTTYPAVEAFVGGSWTQLLTSGSSGAGSISLGTTTAAANPAISGDATTGLYTAGAGKVDVTISGTQLAEWNSSGFLVPTAKIGVGTTSAVASLQVGTNTSGTSSTVAQFGASSAGAASNVLSLVNSATATVNNEVDLSMHTAGTFAPTGMIKNILTNVNGTSDLAFSVYNGSLGDKLHIQGSTGYVGIGATNPANQLHIYNTATAGTTVEIQNADTGGKAWGLTSTGSGSTGGAGSLTISDISDSVSPMTMTSAGYVGIATTSPAFTLDVNGASIFRNNVNISTLISSTANNDLRLYANNATNLGVDIQTATGYVGIGTTSPLQMLDVRGNVNIQNNNGITFDGESSPNFWNRGSYMTISNLQGGGGLDLTNYGGVTSWMRILASNGYVGIGTTLPTQMLTVAGNVDAMSNGYVTEIANAGTTGTTVNTLAKLSSTTGAAVTPLITDTDGIVGVVVGGAGTSGTAQIAVNGQATCVFDGATTAGDFVTISTMTAGDCRDAGSSRPTATQTIGRVLSTNTGAGTYVIALGLNGAISSLGSGINLGSSATTANPAISGDATTGLYTAGAGKVDISISGSKAAEFSSTGAVVSGTLGVGTTPATGAKLDVAGPAKVAGTGSETCSGATAGMMRYNSSLGYMEICQ